MKATIIKTIIAAIILSVIYFFAELVQGSVSGWDVILWGIASNLLIAALLVIYVSTATIRGIQLAIAVFFIYYTIGFFNLLIEAYIFNVTDRAVTLNNMITGFCVTLVYAPILVLLFNKWKGDAEKIGFVKRPVVSWIWRLVLSDLAYLFFYLLAGFILYAVYPPLMEFYEGKIPPFDLMINMQFFRAIVFILVALLILRSMNISILKKAIFIGLFFTIVGGLAPLIGPSEHMPGYIRLGHAFEVAISNFLFGFVISFLLGQKTEGKHLRNDDLS